MAAFLADNVEEEYLWATSLTSTKKVLTNIECYRLVPYVVFCGLPIFDAFEYFDV